MTGNYLPNYIKKLVPHVRGIGILFNEAFNPLWIFLHRGHIVRRAVLLSVGIITYKSYFWCFEISKASGYDPAVIASSFGILTPSSALFATAIKFYNTGRQRNGE
jgi:hypothetical protein